MMKRLGPTYDFTFDRLIFVTNDVQAVDDKPNPTACAFHVEGRVVDPQVVKLRNGQ